MNALVIATLIIVRVTCIKGRISAHCHCPSTSQRWAYDIPSSVKPIKEIQVMDIIRWVRPSCQKRPELAQQSLDFEVFGVDRRYDHIEFDRDLEGALYTCPA